MNGVRIFAPQTIRRAVSEQTYFEIDLTLGLPMRYSLGFMLGGRRLSMFGPNTGKAFGHLGFTNVIAYADPEREVAVCLMTSGKPLLAPALRHVYNVLKRIALHCSRG